MLLYTCKALSAAPPPLPHPSEAVFLRNQFLMCHLQLFSVISLLRNFLYLENLANRVVQQKLLPIFGYRAGQGSLEIGSLINKKLSFVFEN